MVYSVDLDNNQHEIFVTVDNCFQIKEFKESNEKRDRDHEKSDEEEIFIDQNDMCLFCKTFTGIFNTIVKVRINLLLGEILLKNILQWKTNCLRFFFNL